MSGSIYEAKTIPKDSDGNIMVNEYREQTWHTQQIMLKELKRINGTVAKHEKELMQIRDLKSKTRFLGVIISFASGIIGGALVFIGRLKELI